ncbi:MAG: ABC transporter substrate-binding protein [Pseudomonadota bacterium]
MNRRDTVLALVALSAAPLAAEAQRPKKVPRIGFLSSDSPGPDPRIDIFRQGLRDLGYVEGQTLLIELRYGEGRLDRMPSLVNEFVQQQVDIIVATNNVFIRSAKEATKTIPIIMISSIDPVVAGYVESLARPGGNITGVSSLGRDLSAKRMELLKEILPGMSRVAILWHGDAPGPRVAFKQYEAAARTFKLNLQSLEVRGPNPDLEGAFRAAKKEHAAAVIIVVNHLITFHLKRIMELATSNQLPSMNEDSRYVYAGGLLSYGANTSDSYRRAAYYIDKILKGAKPRDLPVEQPTKFELVINLKAAKQIGLAIPKSLLARADEVIE